VIKNARGVRRTRGVRGVRRTRKVDFLLLRGHYIGLVEKMG